MLEYVDRKNTNCVKWDLLKDVFGQEDLLALWVADMDFKAPQEVRDALKAYAERGTYGYDPVPEAFYDAFLQWEKDVHGLSLTKEDLFYTPGVVTGFNWAVLAYTDPDDAILIQPPVYPPFFKAVETNGRTLVTNELLYKDGVYTCDFEDFEAKIRDENVKMFILCSPHNPCGRVWTKEELSKMLEICNKYHVLIVADEIHQDIISPGHRQIPLLSLPHSDNVIAFTAPSKTFNLAGLKMSIGIIKNPELKKMWEALRDTTKIVSGTPFGYIAAEKAYSCGKDWLNEVQAQIWENYCLLRETLLKALPNVSVTPLEGTYLAWVNFENYLSPEEMEHFFTETCRIAPNYGSWFRGQSSGTFIRINLATRKENIEKACERIIENLK